MYVQSVSNYNVAMQGGIPPKKPSAFKKFINQVAQKAVDLVPSATFKDTPKIVERWKKTNSVIANPAMNRLIMGVGALAFQPAIDYHNHRVDEETREIARNRTIAKIIAGATVGILCARWPAHFMVKKMTQLDGKSKFSKSLLPNFWHTAMQDLRKNEDSLGNYRVAWSTFIAMGIMVFTNFLLDAPLTKYLTNKFNSRCQAKKEQSMKEREEVNHVV